MGAWTSVFMIGITSYFKHIAYYSSKLATISSVTTIANHSQSTFVTPPGFEPGTPALKVRCSSQLSYEVIMWGSAVTLRIL